MSEAEFLKLVAHKNNFAGTIFEPAWNALCDDINVPRALGEIFGALPKLSGGAEDLAALGSLLYALGIDVFAASPSSETADAPAEIVELAQMRWEAKKSKDFAKADELRKKITELGWNVLDKKDGFDIKKI